jgi:hypothetical protein
MPESMPAEGLQIIMLKRFSIYRSDVAVWSLLFMSAVAGSFGATMCSGRAYAQAGTALPIDDLSTIVDQAVRANEQKDYAQAIKLYVFAAERGNASAQFRLGEMYYQGRGVIKDLQTAIDWFDKAARQGHSAAKQNVAFVSQLLRLQKLPEYENHTLASVVLANALICPDLPRIELVNSLDRAFSADIMGRIIYGKEASLVKGPPPGQPNPADFGCSRIPIGTLVLVDPSVRRIPFVLTVLPDFTVARGVVQSKVVLRRVD